MSRAQRSTLVLRCRPGTFTNSMPWAVPDQRRTTRALAFTEHIEAFFERERCAASGTHALLHHSTEMPADYTTTPHFSVSSASSLPNSAGDIGIGVPPSSAMRACIFGSASAAVTALLSTSIASGGVPFGAEMP